MWAWRNGEGKRRWKEIEKEKNVRGSNLWALRKRKKKDI